VYYVVVESNVDYTKDNRPNKAKQKASLYRDSKSKTHKTLNGTGVIGKLIKGVKNANK